MEGLLSDWAGLQRRIVKVMPREYKRVLAEQAKREREGAARAVVVSAGRGAGRRRRQGRALSLAW